MEDKEGTCSCFNDLRVGLSERIKEYCGKEPVAYCVFFKKMKNSQTR